MDSSWLIKISPVPRLAGDMAHPGHWVEAMRVIYEYELVIFEDAEYEVEIEEQKFRCPHGSFLIVPPGKRHITRELSGRSGRRNWVHFDWLYSGAFSGRPVMSYSPAKPEEGKVMRAPDFVPAGIMHGSLRSPGSALETFRRLNELFNSDSGRDHLVSRACLLELLLEILAPDAMQPESGSQAQKAASRIRMALSELASLPARSNLSIQETLEELGMSYAHQCRLFKKQYGIAPVQYVAELRMTRIKAMLRNTSSSISQIAELEGFDNLGYFCRLFRRHAGATPSGYRKVLEQEGHVLKNP